MKLKRVFYSAYVPVNKDERLPALPVPPLLREHRLYQADWLLRFYHFDVSELFGNGPGSLDAEFDPKIMWALRHLEAFPVEVNTADYERLLRIPGIGMRSAQKILRARRIGPLHLEDLPKLGVVWKRAKYFLTAAGAYFSPFTLEPDRLRHRLLEGTTPAGAPKPRQMTFDDLPSPTPAPAAIEALQTAITGQF
jgi:predicted DNA-binding helix-hairpin-helix protein